MLDVMRKNRQSILLQIVFGAIVVVFVFWGVGTMYLSQRQVVAEIGECEWYQTGRCDQISAVELEEAMRNLQRMYSRMPQNAGQDLGRLIRGQAIEQLINIRLLTREAERLGLTVTDAELRESIASTPQLQVDGRFNVEAYRNALRRSGLTPAEFEASQREQLLVSKLNDIVTAGAYVPETQVRERFRHQNGKVEVRALRVPAARFRDQVTIGDAAIEKYWEENRESFREPEKVRIRYARFAPEHFADEVEPNEERIQAYYEENRADFEQEEQVRARHILIELDADASEEERTAARARAEELLQQARDGAAAFAALAGEHSDDAGSAASGGDLGWFGRGAMVAPFEEAAFALEPGELSGLVESPFGLHIIRLEERRPARTLSLEEAREEIVAALQEEGARAVARERAEDAYDRIDAGEGFAAVIEETGLEIREPEPFPQSGPVPGISGSGELAEQAFRLPPGNADIAVLDEAYAVFEVLDVVESRIPELAEVRDQVEKRARQQAAEERARTHGAELLEKLRAGTDLETLAEQEDLSVIESGPIERSGLYVAKIGASRELKADAFAAGPEEPILPEVYEVGRDAVIAVWQKRIPADDEEFVEEKDELIRQERQRLAAALSTRFLDHLKERTSIAPGPGYSLGQ